MEKLSTKKIKDLISEWLGTPESRAQISHLSDPKEMDCDLEELIDKFGFKNISSQSELEECLWKTWKDGNNWKRESKEKTKENWDTFLDERWIDFFGSCNQQLLANFSSNEKDARNCIIRCFIPNNESLMDNYRLEVVTTPNDSDVIIWTITED